MKPHDKLRQTRENRGVGEWSVAEAAGISESTYWDLEHFESDLFMTVSLAEIGRIAAVLGLTMEKLFASERPHVSGRKLSRLEPLLYAVQEHVRATRQPLTAFEDEVGWTLSDVLERPTAAWDKWSVDCLRDVSGRLGIDWLSVMQGEFEQMDRSGGNNREGRGREA